MKVKGVSNVCLIALIFLKKNQFVNDMFRKRFIKYKLFIM